MANWEAFFNKIDERLSDISLDILIHLASSEVIGQVLFTSERRAAPETLKIDHSSVNCYRYSSFWRYLFNLCGIY